MLSILMKNIYEISIIIKIIVEIHLKKYHYIRLRKCFIQNIALSKYVFKQDEK